MKWSGQEGFEKAATVPFKVDGKEAGVFKNHGPLSFLKVHFISFPLELLILQYDLDYLKILL